MANVFICYNYELEKIFNGIDVHWTHYVPCFQSSFQKATLLRNGILRVEIEAKDQDFIARGWEVKWDSLPMEVRSKILALDKPSKSKPETYSLKEFSNKFWKERYSSTHPTCIQ
ncbi:MAG: hypothetical protein IKO36_10915 [Bacteroidaceae bacterium]|nr:hypothetical protein [Bacteroidaceae bacterium]